MLDSDRFVKIGQVLKSNGTDGQVLIGLRDFGTEDISETEPVFIDFDGLPVPFFLSGVSVKSGTRFLARLTDVNSLEDAEELVGKAVYYPAAALDSDDGFLDFTGWKLYDSGVLVGEVLGIEDIPGNPCLEVGTKKGTVLVPLHEDLVTDIDEKKKVLSMSLPTGLIANFGVY